MSISLLAMFNETYKRFLIIWDYKFNVLTQLLVIGIIFVGASFFLGNGQFNPQQLTVLFLGYVVWLYARIIIMSTGADLVGEAQAGTLEQMYMTPARTEILILGRVLATLLTTTIMVLLTSIALALLLGISIPLRWEGLVIMGLTLAGLFGFALILGGLTLIFKQVDALADLIQNALLFLTGSLLPITHFPPWLAFFARTLPITQGIDVLRNVLLNGQSLITVWDNKSLIWLIVNSSVYLIIGWVLFKYSERVAKQQGSLSQY
ncbi:MAG: ABC transporter permease [Ktedonobacteraceae bacterium]